MLLTSLPMVLDIGKGMEDRNRRSKGEKYDNRGGRRIDRVYVRVRVRDMRMRRMRRK